MKLLYGYPSIESAHRIAQELFRGNVVVQEKIDGSQFSFGLTTTGTMLFRSKGGALETEMASNGLFGGAVSSIRDSLKDKLIPGAIYRGEAISRPRHNKLQYGRVPPFNVVIFDIELNGVFFDVRRRAHECSRVGFEEALLYYSGDASAVTEEFVARLLQNTSQLGGAQIEGIVIKNYGKDHLATETLIGKIVSEKFKETKTKIKVRGEFIQQMLAKYKTEARWDKAIQHLRDDGKLKNHMSDLKNLIPEIMRDILEEEGEAIRKQVWKNFWSTFGTGLIDGFPSYYEKYIIENNSTNRDTSQITP